MNPFSNPKLVSKTPIITTFLLEGANVQQIVRMWTEHSALGQSIAAWVCVNLALVLWYNFYRVLAPDQLWARAATAVGIILNACVILSVAWFRWVA